MDEKLRKKLKRTWEETKSEVDVDFDSDIPVSEKKVKDTKRREI